MTIRFFVATLMAFLLGLSQVQVASAQGMPHGFVTDLPKKVPLSSQAPADFADNILLVQSQFVNVRSGVRYRVRNVNNWASLRSAISTQSTRLARVPRGATVITTGKRAFSGGLTWLSVSYNGLRGWMPTKFLGLRRVGGNTGTVTRPRTYPVGSYRVTNVNNWASLREWASRSAPRLRRVPRGASVYHGGRRIRAGGELWLNVTFGQIGGWIPVRFLRKN